MESIRPLIGVIGLIGFGGASTKAWGINSGDDGWGETLPSITTPYGLDCADSADKDELAQGKVRASCGTMSGVDPENSASQRQRREM
jgi:hypothetical protein